MKDLIYLWQEGSAVEVSPDVSLAEFYVVGYRQRRVLEVLTSGNYSRLCADILFARSMGYYIIQVYVPSSLIVCMSWVSFYLDRGSAPARVGLGVTTVLTMVTLMGAVNRALPKISYMKALDIYLAFCFFMVFGALLEYATVSYTAKRINLHKRRFTEFKKKVEDLRTDLAKQRERNDQLVRIEDERAWEGHSDFCPLKMEQRKKMSRLSAQLAQDLAPLSPRGASLSPRGATLPSGGNRMPTPSLTLPLDVGEPPTTLFGVRASDIERYSRIAFPLAFFTFHFMYWTILCSISEVQVDDLVP